MDLILARSIKKGGEIEMTDKERLIDLLSSFGIPKTDNYHANDSFVVHDVKLVNIDAKTAWNALVSDSDIDFVEFSDDDRRYSYMQRSSVVITRARLRRVEFIFNDDGSFDELN